MAADLPTFEFEDYWRGPDYRGWLGNPDFTVDDDTPAVLERFQLVALL